MKSLFVCLTLSLSMAACAANKPPDLSPEATKAFYGTQVIKALDHVRDAADDAHHTTPPLIDAQTDLVIVKWHEVAITTVHAAPLGWRATIDSGLAGLQKNLPPATWKMIAPYIQAARAFLKEQP